jgi:hypothetical protein
MPELVWHPVERLKPRPPQLPDGHLVYVALDANDGLFYAGKSDRSGGNVRRVLQHLGWRDQLRNQLDRSGQLVDAVTNSDLGQWSAIVHSAVRYDLRYLAAPVAGTGASAREWEARIQRLSGRVTGNESILGGSAWEWRWGSLRGNADAWLESRVNELQHAGKI